MSDSPYLGHSTDHWPEITLELSRKFPLSMERLVSTVLAAWNDIFQSAIGAQKFKIGKDIFPQPQILGFLLHELIPLKLASEHPEEWCRDRTGHEKDLVCLSSSAFSMEIKTSSSKDGIFGNRSFAQPETVGKKSKSGYYLLVNFQKVKADAKSQPAITMIRFAWLDHSDWIGQAAESGQAASLLPAAKIGKLLTIYPTSNITV